MRLILLAGLLAALLGCAPQAAKEAAAPDAAFEAGCDRLIAKPADFTDAEAPEMIEVSSHGSSCDQAVVLLVVRGADGRPLHAWATEQVWFSADIDTSKGITPQQMDTFLEKLAAVEIDTTAALPDWPASKKVFGEGQEGFFEATPLPRDMYLATRKAAEPRLCYETGIESQACIAWSKEGGFASLIYEAGA